MNFSLAAGFKCKQTGKLLTQKLGIKIQFSEKWKNKCKNYIELKVVIEVSNHTNIYFSNNKQNQKSSQKASKIGPFISNSIIFGGNFAG